MKQLQRSRSSVGARVDGRAHPLTPHRGIQPLPQRHSVRARSNPASKDSGDFVTNIVGKIFGQAAVSTKTTSRVMSAAALCGRRG